MLGKLRNKSPLLDTNVIVERQISDALLSRIPLSSVVLYELIATTIDDSKLALYSSWRSATNPANPLLTPRATDWFECAKLVRHMLLGQKSKTRGRVGRVTSAQQQQNDALIARTATLHDCFVVTSDVGDFRKFEPYMKNLVIVPADDFFDA